MFKKYEFRGVYHLCWKTKREQSNNLIELKRAEINFKIAKQNLTMKIDWYKKNKYYVNLFSMTEYVYFLGCKEVLKRVNEKRKQIKYYIKNLNKEGAE